MKHENDIKKNKNKMATINGHRFLCGIVEVCVNGLCCLPAFRGTD